MRSSAATENYAVQTLAYQLALRRYRDDDRSPRREPSDQDRRDFDEFFSEPDREYFEEYYAEAIDHLVEHGGPDRDYAIDMLESIDGARWLPSRKRYRNSRVCDRGSGDLRLVPPTIVGPSRYGRFTEDALGRANAHVIEDETDARVKRGDVLIDPTSDSLPLLVELFDSLENYPVLDEGLMAEYEMEAIEAYLPDLRRDVIREKFGPLHAYVGDAVEDCDPVRRDLSRVCGRHCRDCGELYVDADRVDFWALDAVDDCIDEFDFRGAVRGRLDRIELSRESESVRRELFDHVEMVDDYDDLRAIYAIDGGSIERVGVSVSEWLASTLSVVLWIDESEASAILAGDVLVSPSALRECLD